MKTFFSFIVKKSVKIFYNKAMCLSIAFCMLFNLSAPAFAGFNFNNEEKQAFAKLNETLQEEYANQELQADPTA